MALTDKQRLWQEIERYAVEVSTHGGLAPHQELTALIAILPENWMPLPEAAKAPLGIDTEKAAGRPTMNIWQEAIQCMHRAQRAHRAYAWAREHHAKITKDGMIEVWRALPSVHMGLVYEPGVYHQNSVDRDIKRSCGFGFYFEPTCRRAARWDRSYRTIMTQRCLVYAEDVTVTDESLLSSADPHHSVKARAGVLIVLEPPCLYPYRNRLYP